MLASVKIRKTEKNTKANKISSVMKSSEINSWKENSYSYKRGLKLRKIFTWLIFHYNYFLNNYLLLLSCLSPDLNPSLKSRTKIQVPNPSPKSKIQSPEEREWDWGWQYNSTGHSTPLQINSQSIRRLDPIDSKSSCKYY